MEGSGESVEAVREANFGFYRALTTQDMESMEQVWAHEEYTRCIHPGWEVLEGWDMIRQSWEAIFSNTSRLIVEPSEVEVLVEGTMAWVSCLEAITSGESGVVLARATNLFVRIDGQWKIVLHHASQISAQAREDEDEESTVH